MMGAWTIDGPEKSFVTLEEVAKWLGLSENLVSQLVRDGNFPVAVLTEGKKHRWRASDVAAWAHLRGKFSSEKDSEEK